MQELINKRTKHSKTFDLGNGQQRTIIQKGQHYFNPTTNSLDDFNGNWELDNTIDNQGNIFGHKVKKADHNLRIYNTSSNKILKFGFNKGNFVEYNLPNIEPVYLSNQATFTEAWINTNIKLTTFPEGIKNDIILKTHGHPSFFSFPVNSTGCTLKQNGNKVEFYDINNILIGSIPEPYMMDVNNNKGSVTLTYDGTNIIFTPDVNFLSTAIYPVTIDPTTTLQPDSTAGIDAYVDEANSTNYGNATNLLIGFPLDVYDFYIKHNLPSDFTNATVNNAYVNLYQYANNAYPSPIGTPKSIDASWDEATIVGTNAPSTGLNFIGTNITFNLSNAWHTITYTTLAQKWANGTVINNGFALINKSDIGGTTYVNAVYSSDYTIDITLRPKFTLDYTPVGGTNVTITSVIATSTSQSINPTITTISNAIITSVVATSTTQAINPIVMTGATIQSILALSQSSLINPIISGDCNINPTIANSTSSLNNPILSTSINLQPSIINSNSQFINPNINAPMNININVPLMNSISNMINPKLNSIPIVVNFDTMRLVKTHIYIDSDTKRSIKSSLIIKFDTLRRVQNSKIYTSLFDTKRIVNKTIQINNDTLRQVAKDVIINFDTSRKLALFRAITYTFDIYFTKSKTHTVNFTTKISTDIKFIIKEIYNINFSRKLARDIKFTLKKTYNTLFKGRWK